VFLIAKAAVEHAVVLPVGGEVGEALVLEAEVLEAGQPLAEAARAEVGLVLHVGAGLERERVHHAGQVVLREPQLGVDEHLGGHGVFLGLRAQERPALLYSV
jgi:hypothetical protein